MKSLWLALSVSAVAWLWASPANPDESPAPAADSMVGKKPGQVRDDNGLKMKLVWCPPGVVTMEQIETVEEPVTTEDEDEAAPKTRRVEKITPVRVLLTSGYWLGIYEVTQAEWKQVMKTEPWKGQQYTKEGPDYPATFVNWHDATDFCSKLTEQEHQAGRLPNDWEYVLPTEAQWERACRARTETKYSFGDDESKLGDYAWFIKNAPDNQQNAQKVGQKQPNPWGLFDMYGNVEEWCRDVYAVKLPGGRDAELKPDNPSRPLYRVSRGGNWCFRGCPSGRRGRSPQRAKSDLQGFRLALSAVRQAEPEPGAEAPGTIDK